MTGPKTDGGGRELKLSVAICTHNRCRLLEGTLRSLQGLTIPPDISWEVIVVDNASTDGTQSVLACFAPTLPLTVVVESRVGLSMARNAAVAAATGQYILWLDDDVVVHPRYLAAYTAAFRQWPDAVFFGGPIAPLFEGTPPQWLPRALSQIGNAYAALDLGDEPRRFAENVLPYGANVAIRAAEQRAHLYDPRLGRSGNRLLSGEEWAVLHALLDEGATGWWVPDARVQHVIPQHRQSLRYLRRYYMGNGASAVAHGYAPNERMWFGRPRWLWREVVTQEIAYRVTRLVTPPAVWSEHLRRSCVAWGRLRPDWATRRVSH